MESGSMNDTEELADSEAERLKDDQAEWEEVYEKFKPRLDELAGYEARVHELEDELENREKLVKVSFEREKNRFMVLTAVFVLATVVFVRMASQTQNPWSLFGAGVLVGIGFAFLARFWLNV